jgi:hypothetical protein
VTLVSAASKQRVVFVTGKGGVGKTTVAAGLAVAYAQAEGRAVLVEFGDGESGERALGARRSAVRHVVVLPMQAVTRLATPLFGSSLLARFVLENFAMKPLVRAAPAVRELSMLEVVRQIAEEERGARVIVDMPASGHSLAWLRVPSLGRGLLRHGPLYDLCDRLTRELVHPDRASVVLVTLPERLVLRETLELRDGLLKDVALPPSRLVINRVPDAFGAAAESEVRALAEADSPLRDAALELYAIARARRLIRDAIAATLHEELGPGVPHPTGRGVADATCRLPRAPSDPGVEVVAAWLRERGAL